MSHRYTLILNNGRIWLPILPLELRYICMTFLEFILENCSIFLKKYYSKNEIILLFFYQAKRDLITGLKSRTKAGRPEWTEFFRNIQQQNHGDVTVFYCGNPTLSNVLSQKCNEFNFKFKKEIF